MIQIRRSAFETNSSSTHSICITKSNDYTLPEKVTFHLDNFGWEFKSYYDTQSKADYLYSGVLGYYYEQPEKIKEVKEWIFKTLTKHGVDCEFATDRVEDGWYAGIDHDMYLGEFLDAVLRNEKTLLRFLFCAESFILTGNDNCIPNKYLSVDIDVAYPHDEYYKGN